MEKSLSKNDLKEAFFFLKTNESPGYDNMSFNVLKKCFGEINELLSIYHYKMGFFLKNKNC